MGEVLVEVDGDEFPLTVSTSPTHRTQLAAMAPPCIQKIGDDEDLHKLSPDESQQLQEYIFTVVERTSELSTADLEAMDGQEAMDVASEVVDHVFSDSAVDEDVDPEPIRCVRVSDEFIETLFTGEVSCVAGMPDDAMFERFTYNPSNNEFNLFFSSEEWEPVGEGDGIPYIETYAIQRSMSNE